MSQLEAAIADVRDLCDGSEPDSLHVLVDAAKRIAKPAGTLVVQTYPPEFGMTGGREVRSDTLMPWAGADGISTDLPVGHYLIVAITEDAVE